VRVLLKAFGDLLKTSAEGFKTHKVAKLSSSLAFHTIFTLGPILLIVMFISKTFWASEAIEGKIYSHIRAEVGDGTALQIQDIIKNASITGNGFTVIISIVLLLLSATSAFNEIQDSINTIWNLEVKPGKGIKVVVRKRLLSFAMMGLFCSLLLISLVINVLLKGMMTKIQSRFPQVSEVVVYSINAAVMLSVVTVMFAIIFKLLPDAMIRWKDVAIGALLTAMMFMAGKYCITLFIIKSDFDSSYDTAGSLIVLLFWIYFSSILLYSGTLFTKAYAVKYGHEIQPNEFAVTIKTMKVRTQKSIHKNEKEIELEMRATKTNTELD
jgi:membrane protein